MGSNTVSPSSVTGQDPVTAAALWLQTEAAQKRYDPSSDLILTNGTLVAYGGTSAIFDIPGDSLGQLNNIMPAIDSSGNNSVLNGFELFTPGASSSQGTIVGYTFETRRSRLVHLASVGSTGIGYSYDGILWTPANVSQDTFNGFASNGNTVLALGGTQKPILYSTNGITWTASSSAQEIFGNGYATAAAWNGSWIAVGYSASSTICVKSTDGVTWTQTGNLSTLITQTITSIRYANSLWVAAGSGTNSVAYSTDGENWIPSRTGNLIINAGSATSILYTNGKWIMGVTGGNGTASLAISQDGKVWVSSTAAFALSTSINALATNGSVILAAGASLIYSPDAGITWIHTQVTGNVFSAVSWNGTNFVAGSSTGVLLTSPDGILWSSTPPIPFANGNPINGFIKFTNTLGTVPSLRLQSSSPISLTSYSTLYIKYGKTAMDSALTIFLQYIASLTEQGMLPNTTPGFQNQSYVNKNLLPSNITAGGTFTIGTTSITPVLKGVYSPAESYLLGDLVYYPDASGSLNMCLIGPDLRGPSYSVITGDEPVEDPFTSPYWHVVINRGWNTWTYDSIIDLALNAKNISTNYIFCDSNLNASDSDTYPANLLLQLSNTTLQGFSLFGSDVNQLTRISSFEYSMASNGSALYALKLDKLPVGTGPLYVKNGLANFLTLNSSAFTNYLSLTVASAGSLALAVTTENTVTAVNSNAASLAVVSGAVSTITSQYPTQPLGPLVYGITQQLSNCIYQYSVGLQIYQNDVTLGNVARIPLVRDNLLGITSTITSINSLAITASSYITNSDILNTTNSLSTITGYTTSIVTQNSYYNNIITPIDIGYSIVTATNYIQVFPANLNNLSLAGNFTIEWVTVNCVSNADYNISSSLFAQLGSLNFLTSNGNLLNPFSGTAFATSGLSNPVSTPPYLNYSIGSNQQNHFAWVRNGSTLKFYVNGYSVYSSSNSTPITGSNLVIGNNLALPGTHWQGGLRNFRVDTSAIYTANFNAGSTITSFASSVFTSNLAPLSTTVVCLPMNQAVVFNDFSRFHSAVSTMGQMMSSTTLAYSTMITPFTKVPVGAGFMTIPPLPKSVAMNTWAYPETSVTATWLPSAGATSYTVKFYYSTTNTNTGGLLLETVTVTGTATSATTTTAIANGLFIYAIVCANNSIGSSIYVSTGTEYVDQPPTNVQLSPWTNTQTTMTVTWTAAPIQTSYTVSFYTNTSSSTTGGTLLQTITGVSGTSQATTATLVYGKYYYATVFAVTNVGNSTTTTSSNALQFTPLPKNPSSVSMTAVPANTNAITVSWTASSYSQSYSVSFYSNPTNVTTGGTLAQTITGISGTTTTTTTTLTAAGFYYAVVTGVNSTGSSTPVASTAATFYTPPCGAVTNQAMSTYISGGTTVTATWTAAPFATSYIVVFYSNSTNTNTGGAVFQTFNSVSGSATSQTTSATLTQGTYYYATVQAVNVNANSSSVTTSPVWVVALPAAPTAVTMATWSTGISTMSVSWTAPARATTYTVIFYYVGTNVTTNGFVFQTITGVTGTSCLTTNALAPGSYYYATVTSVNTTGSSTAATSSNTGFFNPILGPPPTLSLSISSRTLTASWGGSPTTYGTPNYTLYLYTNTSGLTTSGTLANKIIGINSTNYSASIPTSSYRNYYYANIVASVPGLSSIVTSTVTSTYFLPTSFTPTNINSLRYWFDAADGASLTTSNGEVTAWTNKGSAGGSAILNGTFPVSTLNSLNTVNFNYQQYMNIPSYSDSNTTAGTTMFFVMKATSNLVASTSYYPLVNGGGPNLQIAANGSIVNYTGGALYTNSNTTNLSSFTQSFAILSSVENGTTSLPAGLWNNGSNVPFASGTGTSSTAFGSPTIGSSAALGMPFQLAELIIYTSNLPYAHRQDVEGYLAWKWGLQTSLPNNHPYKSLAAGFFCPLVLPGLQMWVDATDPYATGEDLVDGTSLSTWNDKSGKVRNITLQKTGSGTITASASAINNLSAVYFNSPSGAGVRGYSSIPAGTFSSNYTAFTVYKNISLTGQEANWSVLSRSQNMYSQNGETRYVANTAVSDTTTNSNNWILTSNLNVNMLTTYVNYPGGSNVVFSENLNGKPLSLLAANSFTATNATITDTATTLSLTNTNGSGVYAYGNIVYCEALVFNYGLTTLQRQQVEGYLALKWGLQQQLPLYHPYRVSTTPFINPTSAPGLTLWLDGSDPLANGSVPASGSLSIWYDKSGKGFNATAAGNPQYNSNTKAFSFNGNQYYTSTYSGAHPTESAFMVLSFTNPGIQQNQYPFSGGNNSRAVTLYASTLYLQAQQGNNAAWVAFNNSANSNLLFNYTYNRISASANTYAGGTVGSNTNSVFAPVADSSFSIGATPGGGFGMTGTISELIIYNTALSTEDRQNIEGYLAWKWGVQNQLPAGHPYASQPTNLVYPNVNLTPVPLSLPMSQFPGIQVWLDGADPLGTGAAAPATMTTWYDKSGLGQNAVISNTQGAAGGGVISASNNAYGQGMVVPLSTAGRSLVPANTFINAISYFIVYKSLTNTGSEVPVSRGSQGNPWIGPFTTTYGGSMNVAGVDGIATSYTIPNTYQVNTCISYLSINQLSNTISYSLNGTATNVTTTPWAPSDPLNVLTFFDRVLGGNVNAQGGCQFNGIVYEILVFNRAFTTEQRTTIEGYLASRWKLQSVLPPIHSYKSLSPVVAPTYEFTPECLPNLQLWLDASDPLATGVSPRSGFFVNTWYDKSGQMNHAVGSNSPILSSNGILFNGSNQCYVTPYSANSPAETGFIILNMTSPVNNCPFITGVSSNTSRGFWGQMNGSFAFALPSASGAASFTNLGSANSYSTTYLMSYTYNYTGMSLNQNGTVAGSNSTNIIPTLGLGSGTSNPTIIGGSVPGNSANGRVSWMFGTISEVIIYNSVLSSTQRKDVEGYLAWKWGLNANLPTAHPHYYQSPENIAAITASAPMAPQNLTLQCAWGTGLAISWTPNSKAEFYQFILGSSAVTPSVQSLSNASFSGLTTNSSYTIQVVAKNPYGSASSSITASTTSNFNPTTFAGTQAWYDATDIMGTGTTIGNGTAISTWYDKSGNSRNATATGSPVLKTAVQNSLPGIFLSGYTGQAAPMYYTSAIPTGTFASNMSWFAVYAHTTTCANPVIVNRIINGSSWGNPMVYIGSNFYITGSNSGPSTPFTTSYNTQNFSASVLNMNLSQNSAASFSGFTNGNPITFNGTGTIAVAGDTGDSLLLGTIANKFNAGFNGFFHEIIVYNTQLTAFQRQTVEGYLAWKWGLHNQLPSFHMYSSVAPTSTTTLSLEYPQTLPGLQLWLDANDPLGTGTAPANGATLTYLADKSGNSYRTTFETQNSLQGVYYSNQSLTANPTGTYTAGTYPYVKPNTSVSTVIVSRIPSNTFIGATTVFIVYNSYANATAPIFTRTISPGPGQGGNMGNPIEHQGTSMYIGSNNATTFNTGYSFYSPSTSMANVNINQKTGTLSILSNASSKYSGTATVTPSDAGSLFTLFGRGDVGSGTLSANLNEALVFNRPLTKKQTQLVEGYLAWKWGLQTQLPAAHPFYTVPITSVTNLALYSATSTTITVSWGGAIGVTSYTYTVNDTATTPSADNGVANQRATFSGLSTSNSYTFVVNGTGSAGTSSASFTISAADYLIASIGNPLLYLSASQYSGAGSWLDKSPNGNDAELEVGTIAKNAVGNGIVLNGSSYWVTPDLNVGSIWSFSVWYKNTMATNGITTYSCIFAQQSTPVNVHNIVFGDSGNGYIEIGFMDGAAWRTHGPLSSYYTPNTWINTIATWNGTTLNIYINGTRIASTTPGGTSSAIGGGRYIIGNRFNVSQAYRVIGQIGEIRVYNTALSATNVGILYNGTRNTFLV